MKTLTIVLLLSTLGRHTRFTLPNKNHSRIRSHRSGLDYTSAQTLQSGAFTQLSHQITVPDWRPSTYAQPYPPMENIDFLVAPIARLSVTAPSKDNHYADIHAELHRDEFAHASRLLGYSAPTSALEGGGARAISKCQMRPVVPLPLPAPTIYQETTHLDLSGLCSRVLFPDNNLERDTNGDRNIPSLDSLDEPGVRTVPQEQYKPARLSSYTANVVKAILQDPIRFKRSDGRPGIPLQTVLASASSGFDNFLHGARDVVDLGGKTSKYIVIHIKGKQLFKSQIRMDGKPLSLAKLLSRVASVMQKMLENPGKSKYCGEIVQGEICLLGCVNVCKGC